MAQAFWFLGIHINILADEHDTDGRYDLLDCTFAPGTATPWHRHTAYSEQLYVLGGEFTAQVESDTHVLTTGQSFTVPQGAAHAVTASGAEPARVLVVASPSGWAKLIRTVGTAVDAPGLPPTTPPDMELLAQMSVAVGDEILGPPGPAPLATSGQHH